MEFYIKNYCQINLSQFLCLTLLYKCAEKLGKSILFRSLIRSYINFANGTDGAVL